MRNIKRNLFFKLFFFLPFLINGQEINKINKNLASFYSSIDKTDNILIEHNIDEQLFYQEELYNQLKFIRNKDLSIIEAYDNEIKNIENEKNNIFKDKKVIEDFFLEINSIKNKEKALNENITNYLNWNIQNFIPVLTEYSKLINNIIKADIESESEDKEIKKSGKQNWRELKKTLKNNTSFNNEYINLEKEYLTKLENFRDLLYNKKQVLNELTKKISQPLKLNSENITFTPPTLKNVSIINSFSIYSDDTLNMVINKMNEEAKLTLDPFKLMNEVKVHLVPFVKNVDIVYDEIIFNQIYKKLDTFNNNQKEILEKLNEDLEDIKLKISKKQKKIINLVDEMTEYLNSIKKIKQKKQKLNDSIYLILEEKRNLLLAMKYPVDFTTGFSVQKLGDAVLNEMNDLIKDYTDKIEKIKEQKKEKGKFEPTVEYEKRISGLDSVIENLKKIEIENANEIKNKYLKIEKDLFIIPKIQNSFKTYKDGIITLIDNYNPDKEILELTFNHPSLNNITINYKVSVPYKEAEIIFKNPEKITSEYQVQLNEHNMELEIIQSKISHLITQKSYELENLRSPKYIDYKPSNELNSILNKIEKKEAFITISSRFLDLTNNGILTADEPALIKVIVKNHGDIISKNYELTLYTEFDKEPQIKRGIEIQPKSEATILFEIKAPKTLKNGKVSFEINFAQNDENKNSFKSQKFDVITEDYKPILSEIFNQNLNLIKPDNETSKQLNILKNNLDSIIILDKNSNISVNEKHTLNEATQENISYFEIKFSSNNVNPDSSILNLIKKSIEGYFGKMIKPEKVIAFDFYLNSKFYNLDKINNIISENKKDDNVIFLENNNINYLVLKSENEFKINNEKVMFKLTNLKNFIDNYILPFSNSHNYYRYNSISNILSNKCNEALCVYISIN